MTRIPFPIITSVSSPATLPLTKPPNSHGTHPIPHPHHPIPQILSYSKPHLKIGEISIKNAKPTIITSPSNPFIKHCVKLRQSSSYRHNHGSVLVIGTIPIREICKFEGTKQNGGLIEWLFVLDEIDVPEELHGSARVVVVSSAVMKKLSGVQSADSVNAVALMRIPPTFREGNFGAEGVRRLFSSSHRILVLDGIQDPGNLGTLVRSAMAFRWNGVFLLPGCCDPFNEKALRASRGASFQLPIVSGDWLLLEDLLKEFELTVLAGHPANEKNLKPISWLSQDLVDSLANSALCLVLGSEGSGLSEKTVQVCELVSIPMAGEFESLNVSVAGGIFLHMLQPNNHTVL